jgi:hypothetical protein
MPTARPTGVLRWLAATSLVAGLAACAGDPARALEARRARYSADLGAFLVQDDPARSLPRILLDVTVRGDARPPLTGLTLDVSIADAAGREKERRHVFVDTSAVGPGGEQMTLTLDDVDYAPGDGFWVEVRGPVPPAERALYREFEGVR